MLFGVSNGEERKTDPLIVFRFLSIIITYNKAGLAHPIAIVKYIFLGDLFDNIKGGNMIGYKTDVVHTFIFKGTAGYRTEPAREASGRARPGSH